MLTNRKSRTVTTPLKTVRIRSAARMFLIVVTAAAALCGNAQQTGAAGPVQTDCAVDAGPCGKTVERLAVTLDITPKPVAFMSDLTFAVTVQDRGAPVDDAALTIDLSMPGMFMGKNVIKLARQDHGVYTGKGVIVRCPSGKRIWQAMVIIEQGTKKVSLPFVFEVQK